VAPKSEAAISNPNHSNLAAEDLPLQKALEHWQWVNLK
jgi:hypothetical protein